MAPYNTSLLMMDKCRRALGSLIVTHCFTVLMADSGETLSYRVSRDTGRI